MVIKLVHIVKLYHSAVTDCEQMLS